jgi:beta-glucosidase
MDTYHALLLLLLLLLALVSVSDASRPKESRFSWGKEEDFMWGAATAAYQVEGGAKEGGRGECIWDTFAQIPGKIAHGDNGDVAADSYHKYKEDVSLLKGMGLNSYRFSISWSRLIPTGRLKDGVNEVGIAYYNSLIDHLLANSIQPLVTLYHWDLPQVLHEDYGGWLDPRIERDFYDYANLCFTTFGDRVKFWATLNEPWTFAYMGYGVGAFAPGRCSDRRRCSEGDSETEPYLAAHNALNAHAVVVQLYRHSYQPMQNGRIGIVINHDYAWPLRGQGYVRSVLLLLFFLPFLVVISLPASLLSTDYCLPAFSDTT